MLSVTQTFLLSLCWQRSHIPFPLWKICNILYKVIISYRSLDPKSNHKPSHVRCLLLKRPPKILYSLLGGSLCFSGQNGPYKEHGLNV
jgi:hypothetical protein